MNNLLKVLMILLLGSMITACGEKPQQTSTGNQSFVVKKVPLEKKLHFTGSIQPLRESSLSSPVSAVIQSMNFQYGQRVKKGDVVLTLNSSELQKQYNEALTEYLKAKDNFAIARTKFNGTQDLWRAGLISKNNYLSEKSGFDNARVTLMQMTGKLSEMLEKMDTETVPDLSDLSGLSLSEFESVQKALMARHNIIHLKASDDGILLYPPIAGDDKSDRLSVGHTVKVDEVIGLIGDLKGIRVEIAIPEIDIDKVKTGMPATIRGIALGKDIFKGKLVSLNAQASTASGTGLPSFTALAEVKDLSPDQQDAIKIGMSATVELLIESKEQLLIPIRALQQRNGQTVVRIKDTKGHIKTQVVTTGAAEADLVTITSGLKEGDVVVYG